MTNTTGTTLQKVQLFSFVNVRAVMAIVTVDSGIKFSFNFNKKYYSMFGYQLTIIVLTVWAISVKITRWISFTVKEVDRSTSSKRGECPCFADERCFAF